jgi:hypothetical protein
VSVMKSLRLSFLFGFFLVQVYVRGQSCPSENPGGPLKESAPQTVHGLVVLHEGIRTWVELQPDRRVCEQKSIQLLDGGGGSFEVDEGNSRHIETLRGCRITAHGRLGIPSTGYYSAELYMNVEKVQEDAGCVRQGLLPDYSHARPPKTLRRYRVVMHVHYRDEGKVTAEIISGKRTYTPWQAYASYMLTGGFSFYGYCAEGFVMTGLSGTPEAKPWLIDTYAAMDPETAATKGVWDITLRYSCHK